jgi:hypothetical protein
MEKVKCVDCKSWSLKNKQGGSSPMAAHGFGYCEFEKTGTYTGASYQRDCKRFTQAAPATVQARNDFLNNKKGN